MPSSLLIDKVISTEKYSIERQTGNAPTLVVRKARPKKTSNPAATRYSAGHKALTHFPSVYNRDPNLPTGELPPMCHTQTERCPVLPQSCSCGVSQSSSAVAPPIILDQRDSRTCRRHTGHTFAKHQGASNMQSDVLAGVEVAWPPRWTPGTLTLIR